MLTAPQSELFVINSDMSDLNIPDFFASINALKFVPDPDANMQMFNVVFVYQKYKIYIAFAIEERLKYCN